MSSNRSWIWLVGVTGAVALSLYALRPAPHAVRPTPAEIAPSPQAFWPVQLLGGHPLPGQNVVVYLSESNTGGPSWGTYIAQSGEACLAVGGFCDRAWQIYRPPVSQRRLQALFTQAESSGFYKFKPAGPNDDDLKSFHGYYESLSFEDAGHFNIVTSRSAGVTALAALTARIHQLVPPPMEWETTYAQMDPRQQAVYRQRYAPQ